MGFVKSALIAAAFAFLGCGNTRVQTAGASAPHNIDATRTWWVVRDAAGNDQIIMCDTYLLNSRGKLCMAAYP